MFAEASLRQRTLLLSVAAMMLPAVTAVRAPALPFSAKAPVTVADAIAMTRLGANEYFAGLPSKGLVAQFSPDGSLFVIVLRKGNLRRNTNDFSVLLYHTDDVFGSPKPDLLVKMSSSSNRDAIAQLRWLSSRTIEFLGETRGKLPQVFTFDVITHVLQRLTNHQTLITTYDVSPDSREVVFAAEPERQAAKGKEQGKGEIVVESQSLSDLLRGEQPENSYLFIQRRGRAAIQIRLSGLLNSNGLISISPNRRYVLLGYWWREVPQEWMGYAEAYIQTAVVSHKKGQLTDLSNLMLLDTTTLELVPLINAPNPREGGFFPRFSWAPDSQALFLKSYLPLDVADAMEKEERSRTPMSVVVKLPGRKLVRIGDDDLRRRLDVGLKKDADVDVALEEDMNTPPKIYVTNTKTNEKALLCDLNPRFESLDFGQVVSVSWKATDGQDRTGGLFFPPGYKSGGRYPLIIQTHGFWKDRFSMDGSPEWSSAFAARVLAARGFIVLQAGGIPISGGPDEGPSFQATIEGAIDDLERKGLIDRNRVGIAGFSRTVYEVGYVLTHSNFRFGAAVLADGITGGYFDYLAWRDNEEASLNGGLPFGDHLNQWLQHSPGFNLDKVNLPVRIVALGPDALLEMWEWFAGLKLQNKPVDFTVLPDAVHLLERPRDRQIAMQSLVDWFSFWLLHDETHDASEEEQYARWEQLRSEVTR